MKGIETQVLTSRFPRKPVRFPRVEYRVITAQAKTAVARQITFVRNEVEKPKKLSKANRMRAPRGETAPLGIGLCGSFTESISLS